MAWLKYMLLVGALSISAVLSASAVPIVRRFALRHGVVDRPHGRKAHREPTPLLGGVAIWATILVVVALAIVVLRWLGHFPQLLEYLPSYIDWRARLPYALPKLLAVLAGATLMLILGLVDDVWKGKLDYRTKFPVQFAVAALAVAMGIRTQLMPGQVLDVVVSVVWIVGITNAFNLLDNMDGLAAGVAAISGLAFLIVTASQNQDYMAFLLATISGASLGFLRYNFHPARIFMGDAGSLTLGFLFGTSTILASYIDVQSPTFAPVFIPILVLSVPIFDTLSVMFIRWREGRPLFVGDRRHFSHRLVDAGLSQRNAVTFIYLVNAGIGMGAVLLPKLDWLGCWIVFIQAAILYGLLTILMVASRSRPTVDSRKTTSTRA